MTSVFVIGGKAGSGKSVLGRYLKEELENIGRRVCLIQITAPLYYYAKTYFNWDGNMHHKPRSLLQKLGVDIIKTKLNKPNFLLNRLYDDIEILENNFDTFIITDARFINEFVSIKNKYSNVKTIKVIRDNYDNGLSVKEKEHITEKELDDYNEVDYVIKNTNIENMKLEAFKISEEEK